MSRDPLTRMDVDTRWPFHRKMRRLRAAEPKDWPAIWTGYMSLLAEAWYAGDRRLTLEECWLPDIDYPVEAAAEALEDVGFIDRMHRIPLTSWKEWFIPVENRIRARSAAGRIAAEKRWNDRPERNPTGMRSQCTKPASQPAKESSQPRARGRSATGRRAWSKLGDELRPPTSSEQAGQI